MPESHPWSANWDTIKQLDQSQQGAQGVTFLVRSRANGKDGVAKLLRKQAESKVRTRMRIEVSNLTTLAVAGLKVPHVVQDGTEAFGNPTIPLYFIMDYIEGSDLEKVITEKTRLPLEDAIALTLDLARTIANAHEAKIIHRDIKPGNIIVRDFDTKDAVIVDYGLSFNEAQSDDLGNVTETDETVGNKFFVLPETGWGGEDKRDKRSDVTLLAGIFYYCLTGLRPKILQGHNNLPPHKRPGKSIDLFLTGDPRLQAVQVMLDRAFQFRQDDRFQSCNELIARLGDLSTATKALDVDPFDFAAEAAADIYAQDRATQLTALRSGSDPVMQKIRQYIASTVRQKLGRDYVLNELGLAPPNTKLPDAYEHLQWSEMLMLTTPTHQTQVIVAWWFAIAAMAQECYLFRLLTRDINQQHRFLVTRDWQKLLAFNLQNMPTDALLHGTVNNVLVEALTQLKADILSLQKK